MLHGGGLEAGRGQHVMRPAPDQLRVYVISMDILLCRRARLPVLVVRGVEEPGQGGAPEAQPGA